MNKRFAVVILLVLAAIASPALGQSGRAKTRKPKVAEVPWDTSSLLPAAATQVKFLPARKNGEAVSEWVKLEYRIRVYHTGRTRRLL